MARTAPRSAAPEHLRPPGGVFPRRARPRALWGAALADAPAAPQRAYPLPAIRRLAALARRPSARSGLPFLVDSPDVPAPVGRRQQVGGPELLVETHPRQLVRQRAAGHRRPNLPLRSLFRFTRSLLRPPPFIANFLSYIHFNLFQWLFEDFLKGYPKELLHTSEIPSFCYMK